jgi:Tfp pilus assembly protein PilF
MPARKKSTGAPLRSEQRDAALEEYEKGVRLLQQKDYQKAIPRFEKILEDFAGEAALCDRARMYLRIARKESAQRQPLRTSRAPEDQYPLGVFLLNQGEFKDAVRHLERAAEHAPQDPEVHVSLASARLQSGDREGSMVALRKAVEIEPKIKLKVRLSTDFDALDDNEEFDLLIHGDV